MKIGFDNEKYLKMQSEHIRAQVNDCPAWCKEAHKHLRTQIQDHTINTHHGNRYNDTDNTDLPELIPVPLPKGITDQCRGCS